MEKSPVGIEEAEAYVDNSPRQPPTGKQRIHRHTRAQAHVPRGVERAPGGAEGMEHALVFLSFFCVLYYSVCF